MIRHLNRLIELLEIQIEISKKMEAHLYDLTLPPDMKKWSQELKDKKTNIE